MVSINQQVIFDLDGTLTDQSELFLRQASSVAGSFGVAEKQYQTIVDAFYLAHDDAIANHPEHRNDIAWYMKQMGKTLGVAVSDTEALQLAVLWKQAHEEAMKVQTLFPDVIETLSRLKQAGCTLYLASGNTKENRQEILTRLGINHFFTDIFAAQTIGQQKQRREFWEKVMKILKLSPSEVTVVGNQLNDDVWQPKEIGMQTILIKRPSGLARKEDVPNVVPEYTIASLSELVLQKNTKRKVCFVMQSVTPGTHMDYVYEMARALREEKGLALTLVVEKTAPAPCPSWVLVQRWRSPLLRTIENFFLVLKLRLTGHQTFYIHYSFISAISAGIITRVLGGKVYYWNAGMPWLYRRSWFVERYQKLTYKLIDVLVTGAEALVEGYSSYYKIPKESIKVISNWIDLTEVNNDTLVRKKVRQELGILETSPVLLFVQKLSKRKGAHLLPEIFDTLKDDRTHLIIAGDGPEEKRLHEWANGHKAQARIHFTGRVSREKMKELYQSADIFLLPSEEEGSSHSLIEAMAHQLPLVGFAVGGVPETVPPALGGYLYPFGDVAGMVSGIRKMLIQPGEIMKAKQQEEQWVQRYDKQRIMNQFFALLSE